MALVQNDLVPGSGDQLLTLDTDTNLEWLNLTATAGQSYLDVLGGFGGFIGTLGFDFATGAQVGELFAHANISKGLSEPAFTPSPNDIPNHNGIQTLQDLMGGKAYLPGSPESLIRSHGIEKPPSPPSGSVFSVYMRYLSLNLNAIQKSHTDVTITPGNKRDPMVGSYLVRPVSVASPKITGKPGKGPKKKTGKTK